MTNSTARTAAMAAGRRADTDRRRQRVLTALNNAINNGSLAGLEKHLVTGLHRVLARYRR
jgi:hypothetical protein